jgi:hypothetical protein
VHRVFARAHQDCFRWLRHASSLSSDRKTRADRLAHISYSRKRTNGSWRALDTSAFVSDPIELPPPFTLVRLRESRDAFTHATEIAEDSGAGTLAYVGRFDLAEFAVVLEPSEPLRTARRAFYAGMVALTDALRAYAPPNKEIAIDWPDGIRLDRSLVGGGRLGWPPSAREDEAPRWLVFGAMIRTVAMGDGAAGEHPLASALDQEGFGDAGAVQVTESFARHLMLTIDGWQVDGFEGLAREYLSRLPREQQTARRIDGNGDLLVGGIGTDDTRRYDLRRALAAPSWLDAKLGGPRL